MLLAIFLLAVPGILKSAVIVDRIAVILDKHAIKASDIDRDLATTEFLNGEALKFSGDARRKAANRLIEQTIIHDEIAKGGIPVGAADGRR